MTDLVQYRQVVNLEYQLGEGNMKIDMEGTDDNYYSKLDEVEINPQIVDLKNLVINKNYIKMQFSAPVMCNVRDGKHFSSMMIGVKFEGDDKEKLVERIDRIAGRFGPLWDESVQKRKEEILYRSQKEEDDVD